MKTTVNAPSVLFASRPQRHVRAHTANLIVLAKQRKQPASGPVGAPARIPGRAPSHTEAAASTTEPATSFRIVIQGRNVSVTPAIKQHLESKLISAVSSFEAVIREVRALGCAQRVSHS